jgi:hypothetical protein
VIAAVLAGCSQLGLSNPFGQQPGAPVQAGMLVGGATREMGDVRPVGGFLPRPDLLAPGGPGRPALVYLNPKLRSSQYRKILLDPVTIWAGPTSDLAVIPADQQLALANTFYSDLYNALKGHCQMVRTPSPGTLHMRFALVDTKVPNATLNTVATYTPYASTAYSAASFVFNKGVGYFAGTATGEGYATDAVLGTLLWEAVDKRGGTTTLVANTLDDWRDIHHVFEAWGIQARTRLQDFGVCRK